MEAETHPGIILAHSTTSTWILLLTFKLQAQDSLTDTLRLSGKLLKTRKICVTSVLSSEPVSLPLKELLLHVVISSARPLLEKVVKSSHYSRGPFAADVTFSDYGKPWIIKYEFISATL